MAEAYAAYQQQPRYSAEDIERRRRDRERRAAEEQGNNNDNEEPAGDDNRDEDPEGDPARLESTWWCVCGHCNQVPYNASIKMCVCCQEQDFENLVEKLDNPEIQCITKHTDFEAVCLTNAVLEMMEAYTRERRGYGVNVGWTNRLYRLLAYQSYTYWIHRHLGKSVRRVIPACVVNSIRESWPQPNPMEYVSYKDADEDELIDAWAL